MLRITGRYADGWIPSLPMTPGDYAARLGVVRQAAEEAGQSRIYGGIHFRAANEAGLQSGLRLGQFVMENSLLPRNDRSRIK